MKRENQVVFFKEEGGKMFGVLILIELKTCIELFLLLVRSLPD